MYGKGDARVSKRALLEALALAAFVVGTTTSVVSAAGNGNGNGGGGNDNGNKGQVVTATPELDSLLLFGTGVAGLAGYAALRWRARR